MWPTSARRCRPAARRAIALVDRYAVVGNIFGYVGRTELLSPHAFFDVDNEFAA